MAKATRVFSTPPTNTSATNPSSSRRGLLVQAAGGAALGAALPLSAPAAAQTLDAELIELGARFEPLVDRYYVAQRRWSGSLARAHAEHDRDLAIRQTGTTSIRQRSLRHSRICSAGHFDRGPSREGAGRVLGGRSPVRRRH
jgi:hypothetical protein